MFFEVLNRETESDRNYLLSAPIIEEVMLGNFTMGTYIAFLNQAYHHVRHTLPLLMAAGARLGPHQMNLQEAIVNYIAEEAGHEDWILNDLVGCGVDREEFSTAPAPFESEMMVAYLYDTVQRNNPVGIFGMVLVLEGTSAGLATEVGKIVQEKLALPEAATSYLTSHGILDQGHMQGFEKVMDSIVDETDQQAIIHVARCVYRLYGDVYRGIPQEAIRFDQVLAA